MVRRINTDAPLQRLDLSLSQVQLGSAETDIVPTTPKTPADEGKDFFLSERSVGEQPIRVYELRLDPDGGPNKQRSASTKSFTLSMYPLTRDPTVYSSPTCLYPLHPTRIFGCGDTCLEKWCI